MKIITIALLLFCVQVAAGIVNFAGDYTTTLEPQGNVFSDVQGVSEGSYFQNPIREETFPSFGFGDVRGFVDFIVLLGLSIFAIPWLLTQFGVAAGLAFFFSLPVYFIYGLGIIQFIANRASKGMR